MLHIVVIRRLHQLFAEQAAEIAVANLTIGLDYVAVVLEDGSAGIAYTWVDSEAGCSFAGNGCDPEGGSALPLLEGLFSESGVERSVGMATVNALNHHAASLLLVEAGPADGLVLGLRLSRGSKVAMVGYVPSVADALVSIGVELDVLDASRGMGDPELFEKALGDWAEALILSGSTLLNGTAEDLLSHAGPGVRAAVLGPTTPLVASAFDHLPVDVLAGMPLVDVAAALAVVRHGGSTHDIEAYARKVYCLCPGAPGSGEGA